jgi:glutamate carboxypeptidase
MPDLADALEWLSRQAAPMERLVERLVRINSFTRNAAGVEAVVEVAAAELARIGLSVERIPGERFGSHLAFSGPAPGPAVFLLGHTDTVFPPGHFEGYRSDGRRACGPGAFDMKGGIAVMVFGLEALARAGLLGRTPVRGLLVSDEEVGSPGSQPLTRARAAGSACALCFESGRAGDRIVVRRKGVAALRVEATGVAAHAGNDHARGRNAIWALARFVDRAQALTDPAQGLTVNVGVIEGGSSKNTVPARAACEVDLRFGTRAEGEALAARLEGAAAEAALPGTRLEVRRTAWREPMVPGPEALALAREYGECQAESGLGSGEAPLAGGGSDASTTSAAGIPSIDGLGPAGTGYHTTEEQLDLASLVPKAAALCRFLARRARG